MTGPSDLLLREATSSLQTAVSWGLIGWIGAVVGIRQLVLIDRRPVDSAVHAFVGLLLLCALLRQAAIQSALIGAGLSLGEIRTLTHTLAIGSAAGVFVVGLLWQRSYTLKWAIVIPALTLGTVAYGGLLYAVARPAITDGLAIEELRSWRTGLYMFLYGIPTPLASVLVAGTAWEHIRGHVARSRTLFGLAVLVCIAGSTLDHVTRIISGFMLAHGVDNAFTEARSHSNDLFLLPVVGLLACVGLPSIYSSVRVRLGKDSASRNARTLAPMWLALRAAVPEVGVPDTHDIPVDSNVVEHRILIDIEDAVHALLPHYAHETSDTSPQRAALDLKQATERARRTERPRSLRRDPPSWLQDECRVLAVASAWTELTDNPEWTATMTSKSTDHTPSEMPHPPHRVPLLGDVLGMDSERPNQRTLHQMTRLGPLYRRSFIGGANLTFAGSAQLMAEVSNEARWERFAGRPIQRLKLLGGEGLFTTANDSPEWAIGHETLMPGFTKDAMVTYHTAMQEVAAQGVAALTKTPELTDAAAFMGNVALEVIGRCGFSYSFQPFERSTRHPFAEALTRTLAYSQQSAVPVLGAVLGRRRAKQATADRMFLRSTVLEVIADRKQSQSRHPDLLDLMLHADGPTMSDDLIADQVITFLVAGHETTGNLLAFVAHYMSHDHAIGDRIADEVAAVCGDQPIGYSDVAKLRYTRAVVSETLRLWPTAPGFFRVAREDTTLGGYDVKKGEWVFMLLLGVHRDPAAWGPTAADFNPERFLHTTPAASAYKPFGTGPRACIGRAFGLHEAVLMVASLAREITFEPISEQLDVEENLTLRPRNLALRVRDRAQTAVAVR